MLQIQIHHCKCTMFDKNRFFNQLDLILHISELHIHVHVRIHTLYMCMTFGFELDLVENKFLLKMNNKQPIVICLQLKFVSLLPCV